MDNQKSQQSNIEIEDEIIHTTFQCKSCAHVQLVQGLRSYGSIYYGSGQYFCDACDGHVFEIGRLDENSSKH